MVLFLKSKGFVTTSGEGTSLLPWQRSLGIFGSVSIFWSHASRSWYASGNIYSTQILTKVPQSSILSCQLLLLKSGWRTGMSWTSTKLPPLCLPHPQNLNSSWTRRRTRGTLSISSGHVEGICPIFWQIWAWESVIGDHFAFKRLGCGGLVFPSCSKDF